MFDLHSAFQNFSPDLDVKEPAIDGEFITDFLLPYFRGMPREKLAALVAETILTEQDKHAGLQRRC